MGMVDTTMKISSPAGPRRQGSFQNDDLEICFQPLVNTEEWGEDEE